MNYRLVALDVDGTLINDELKILPNTKKIIKRAYGDGVIIALSTGRNPESTLPLMEELGVEGPLITHNGALCFHSTTRQIYGEVGFSMAELAELVRYCRDQKIHFDVNTAFQIYVERMTPHLEELYGAYFAKPILLQDIMEIEDEVVKLSILDNIETVDRIMRELPELFPHLRFIQSGENYIDVMHPDVNKGKGLDIVCKHLGISLDEVIALGNFYNDIEMLSSVGMGIAMENSPNEVKAAAKAVTRSNNEEGVYHALKKYLF